MLSENPDVVGWLRLHYWAWGHMLRNRHCVPERGQLARETGIDRGNLARQVKKAVKEKLLAPGSTPSHLVLPVGMSDGVAPNRRCPVCGEPPVSSGGGRAPY